MSIFKEFKEFAMRGNVVDLAVGVIIGGAFSGIVQSFIKDLIMPIIGIAGNVDFSTKAVLLKPADEAVKGSQDIFLRYGNFITVLINFVILAFCIFLLVKLMNRLWKKPEAAAGPTTQEKLLMEIRDAIRARN